jgi:cellulose synthase (UDP-forming)
VDELHTWGPLFLVAGLLLINFVVLEENLKYARAFGAVVCIGAAMRYLYWRCNFTLPPDQSWAEKIWSWGFLGMEVGTVVSTTLVQFFMSRHIDRKEIADARKDSPLLNRPVDVFIATYNEEQMILERTIVGARALEHPDLRIWVLDDGARAWVKELAEELGVYYASRVRGKNAKAGNINNGLKLAMATGRHPEFVLLLDADFVPFRKLLNRTLCLFEEEDVGIVQTPQHFFNRDPMQSKLLSSSIWPDEQRFFFNLFMPCRDAWGAAFCCGTSAVIRVAALEACGGMATETLTEDLLTTIKMGEHGYRTIFMNERLSMGLAPEGLKQFITQRARWCLGTIQQLFTRWSFWGRGRMGVISRIGFLDSILYWTTSALFKMMLLGAPILYWFTGTSVIRASLPELVYWMAPMAAANLIFMSFLSEKHILPVMTDITQLLIMFAISRTVVTGLIRPFGRKFKVTAKGISSTEFVVHWKILLRLAGLGVLTILGMLLHVSKFSPYHGRPGYSLNVIWSLMNGMILFLACALCVEPPKRRIDERFESTEKCKVRLEGGSEIMCMMRDISLSGACLRRDEGWRGLVGPASLVLEGGLTIPFEVVRRRGKELGLRFPANKALRRELIVRLFTGVYNQDAEKISVPQVFRTLAKVTIS